LAALFGTHAEMYSFLGVEEPAFRRKLPGKELAGIALLVSALQEANISEISTLPIGYPLNV
jgi:hypothetical protein